MKLISVEPTPSPNSMKINVDELLPRGQRFTYKVSEAEQAPPFYRNLLQIEGVRSVFRTADFIALDRRPGADWSAILHTASQYFDAADSTSDTAAPSMNSTGSFGEAQVLVQMFRGIPMQIRVRHGDQETRSALPDKFGQAVSQAAGSSMIRERKLEEFGVRYGDAEEIIQEVIKELDAAYSDEHLQQLIAASIAQGSEPTSEVEVIRPTPLTLAEVTEKFQSADWQERYAALDRYVIDEAGLDLIEKAIHDEHTSIRRLAVVYLGDLESKAVLPLLFTALQDSSASVRRTAGDTVSDLGHTEAIGPMIKSLKDKNKLVRWRAARFLYEAGDETATEALREAANDSEFEIQLQARMALERIERGEEAAGSIWQQMTAARKQQQ
ncbi:conserved virulence factor C family protein [Paenibacillus yanchengensis]|uniref:Conserved virulence factor C family protein n=1 Tax=Paenibacillus yanchengensis TaxID=2035833 RepID=A0ABW4YIH5_9BACL